MKKLMIIGARGFGRELFHAARESIGFGTEFVIKGSLDSNSDALVGFNGYPPILGSPEKYQIQTDDVFISALGDPKWRRHYVKILESKGAEFISLIHRSASIGGSVEIGKGSYIAHNAILTADIKVGSHTCIFHGAFIGHDCKIGDFVHISVQSFLGGGVYIEDGVVLHPGVRIVPHKKVCKDAVVGIGSVVISSVKPSRTVFGVPAQEFM